uniref:NADH-ubiquinone oxidoreductase chain 4 n=1 Tax=Stenocranus matsumurai TaxID=1291382 RepID=A0A7S5DC36_9HEMI|nr:NADH dehydrogenase subunit 4 [Stenocranus matsumurai]
MLGLILMNLFLIPMFYSFNFYLFIYYMFFFLNYFVWFFGGLKFFNLISLNLGIDSYSYGLFLLTIWICILMLLSMSNLSYLENLYLFFVYYFVFFFLMICFLSLTFFSFYFFFECSVLPVFLLIYGWGYQPERLSSSLFFLFYTLFSSLPMLLLIFDMENFMGFFYFDIIFNCTNFYIYFFFIFSFLVKLPMFFFHLWLPSAHVEAPSSGSMILAGVMLKLGGYGLIRVLKFFPLMIINYSYFFISFTLLGSLFISFFCLFQMDMKVLVAYSSVSHMGLVISGLMTLTSYGFLGSFFLMISHGLVSSGLFYLVGCLYDRFGSRSMFLLSGLILFMPSLCMFFFLLCVSNMSCPPSLNLVSEIFIIFSMFFWCKFTFLLIFFCLFFTACSMIFLFSFTVHGVSSNLVFYVDGGLVREFYIIFMHLFPLYLFILNLNIFL